MGKCKNTFKTKSQLKVNDRTYEYFRLKTLEEAGICNLSRLPFSIRVLLESVLRNECGEVITETDILNLANYNAPDPGSVEIPFKPARVILQDFTGVPSVVDLAALRSAMARMGGDPERINPMIPVDLVVDHSIQVDYSSQETALEYNAEKEFERNAERYSFLRWGQKVFKNFRVIPPGSGIVHQINLEYLASVVHTDDQKNVATIYPDSLVGTDSHTTMINGLGVIGWGVGGIEAEAVMLGEPIFMRMPEVVGFKLTGSLSEGCTATDLVLRVTQVLRETGVVGKFVEYFGSGIDSLSLEDRATLANMAPEYGATMGFFPVDKKSLAYLRGTGRDSHQIDLVEKYLKEQNLFHSSDTPEPEFTQIVHLNMSEIEPAIAGPRRPQDRIALKKAALEWKNLLEKPVKEGGFALSGDLKETAVDVELMKGKDSIDHGSVVIAAITSCTNTSNPAVMLGAGIMAKKAVKAGLTINPHVKRSLAPGSKVATEYLTRTGLLPYLERLGFQVVGYGCTTCIGNSGPLESSIIDAVTENKLIVTAVLSGNRNFEGRVSPYTRANYLASPPLVLAYALAGTMDINLMVDPVGKNSSGKPVFLKDIWPSSAEIEAYMDKALDPEMFHQIYDGIENSNSIWNAIPVGEEPVFNWDPDSNYIHEPPFFQNMDLEVSPIKSIENARVLVKVGRSITTDHISPAGSIDPGSPAGEYLISRGVESDQFNSYGSRRGNDLVMTRGTFANIRLKNEMAPGTEGGWTTYIPEKLETTIYDAAERYNEAGITTIAIAGEDYGMGSSRDWAAKGTVLLGIKAVIAESFERIHRSNLIGMGVLPLQFMEGETPVSLGLTGWETYTIPLDDNLKPGQIIDVKAVDANGNVKVFQTKCRIDTPIETIYYRNGGILHTVLRKFLKENS